MAAVAFGGVQRYAAVRLYPLVVVRRAAEGVRRWRWLLFDIVLIRYSTLLFFVKRNLGPQEEKSRAKDDFLLIL